MLFINVRSDIKKMKMGWMGISIVKRILELLNGNIECQSIEGSGTKLTVNIQK